MDQHFLCGDFVLGGAIVVSGPLLLGIVASVFNVLGDLPTLPASVTIFVSNLMTFGGMMLLYFVGISLYTGFLFRLPSFLHGWGVLALFFGSLLRFSFDYSVN